MKYILQLLHETLLVIGLQDADLSLMIMNDKQRCIYLMYDVIYKQKLSENTHDKFCTRERKLC